jgi:hypothetical protein
MTGLKQFAVLQKDATGASPEQLKRAFSSFNNLTEADAVRLAVSAHGILMRHVGRDEARAFQQALQAEGVGTALVAEDELPKLPEGKLLHRLELTPAALQIYDLMGRSTAVPWNVISLLAAGAVRHVEVTRTQTERTEYRLNAFTGVWPKKISESQRKVQSESQLALEIILADGAMRYHIDGARFPFNYVINEPSLSTSQKFIWLVRELCHRVTSAVLNGGARWLRAGHESVPGYVNRQALTDEIVWLLWQTTQKKRAAAL